MIFLIISDNSLQFDLDKSLYNSDTLYKCLYWYSNTFDITIEDSAAKHFHISLKEKEGVTQQTDFQQMASRLKQDLIDFKLRDIVTKETRTIRELITAKAFSHYEEELQEGIVSDPVGFDPQEF